jgi:RecA/RadA recombinase
VDLAALVVVRAESTIKAARAADHLLRSGGFALVILDMVEDSTLRNERAEPAFRGSPTRTRAPSCA